MQRNDALRQMARILLALSLVLILFVVFTVLIKEKVGSVAVTVLMFAWFMLTFVYLLVINLIFPSLSLCRCISKRHGGKGEMELITRNDTAFYLWIIVMHASIVAALVQVDDMAGHWRGRLFIASIICIPLSVWSFCKALRLMKNPSKIVFFDGRLKITGPRESDVCSKQVRKVVLNDKLTSPLLYLVASEKPSSSYINPVAFSPFMSFGPRRIAELVASELNVPLEIECLKFAPYLPVGLVEEKR